MLHAFFDVDWANNKDDFTSTSAFIVYLSRNPISWSSNNECNVARSFMSLFIHHFVNFLGIIEQNILCSSFFLPSQTCSLRFEC